MKQVSMGFAQVDITPDRPMQTVGFNRADNRSVGIHLPLAAQASVWETSEDRCCLVAIDHIGFMAADANRMRDRIGAILDIPRDRIMLCFSHTHAAPNISLEPDYFEYQCERVETAVRKALGDLSPVRAAWGRTEADIGVNRRRADGALDRRIGILRITDAATGAPRLLLLRVTAHANTLGPANQAISPDWIGVARNLLESEYGCPVMLTLGAAGNVRARWEGAPDAPARMAAELRHALSGIVGNLVSQDIHHLAMSLQMETFSSDVPTVKRAREIAAEAWRECAIGGDSWLAEVQRLRDRGITEQLAQIEIQSFAVGDGCLCGVPNEIMCELAIDAARERGDDFHLGGYTNGCDGYLPTAAEFDRGGYEVLWSYLTYHIYHGRVMPFRRDSADRLVQAAVEASPKPSTLGSIVKKTYRTSPI